MNQVDPSVPDRPPDSKPVKRWPRSALSRDSPFRRLLFTVQSRPRADEQPAVGDRRGSDDAFAHVVAGQDIQFRAAGEHDDLAVLPTHVSLAVAGDGRCQMTARVADAFVIPEL